MWLPCGERTRNIERAAPNRCWFIGSESAQQAGSNASGIGNSLEGQESKLTGAEVLVAEDAGDIQAEDKRVALLGRGAKPGAVLARFMELRGHRVVEACNTLWHSTEGGFLMSLPYHRTLDPDPEELMSMIRSVGASGAWFPSHAWPGLPRGVYLYSGKTYGLQLVHPSFRRKVRRGLDQLHVRPVEPSELMVQGLQLNLDTMARQGRHDPEFEDPRNWKQLVEALRRSSGMSAVGAFLGDRLAAYMIICREDRGLHIVHQMSRAEDLKRHPNHVLTFEVTRQAVEDPDIDFVSYGLMSLVSTPGLHDYKVGFGYRLIQHNAAFLVHPWLAPVLNSTPARVFVQWLRSLKPQDQRLERLETVLRGAVLAKEWASAQLPADHRLTDARK